MDVIFTEPVGIEDDIVIAYEPVWAIGTGKVATPDQAEETQAAIRSYIKEAVSAEVADKARLRGGSRPCRQSVTIYNPLYMHGTWTLYNIYTWVTWVTWHVLQGKERRCAAARRFLFM